MELKQDKPRNQFIKDWTDTVISQSGADPKDNVMKAYVALTVSQIMDSAIKHKEKLDIGFDDGYEIKS